MGKTRSNRPGPTALRDSRIGPTIANRGFNMHHRNKRANAGQREDSTREPLKGTRAPGQRRNAYLRTVSNLVRLWRCMALKGGGPARTLIGLRVLDAKGPMSIIVTSLTTEFRLVISGSDISWVGLARSPDSLVECCSSAAICLNLLKITYSYTGW